MRSVQYLRKLELHRIGIAMEATRRGERMTRKEPKLALCRCGRNKADGDKTKKMASTGEERVTMDS